MDKNKLIWRVEVLQRGNLVDVTRAMRCADACLYYRSMLPQYPVSDGFRLRVVGYQ